MAKTLRQSKGGRKEAKVELPTDESSRTVVQWFTAHHHMPPAEISRLTGLQYQFCRRWSHREGTAQQTKPGKKRGRPPVIPDSELEVLAGKVRNKRFASAEQVRHDYVNPKTGKAVARRTAQRRLHAAGLRSVRVRKCCFLTVNHREHRLWFANLYRHEDWRRWIISDEKWFYIGGIKGNEKMWVSMQDPDPEERYVGRTAHPTKVMVWGAVSYTGRSALHFFDSKVDGQEYQQAVQKAMLSCLWDEEWMNLTRGKPYVFQQDGARCHTSASTEGWLEDNLPREWTFTGRGGWCPNSPDLSIIENVWAVLQDKVVEDLAFTEEKLSKCIEDAWWGLDQSIIQNLYHDIDRRIEDVIDRDGGRIPKMK
jgi:hypothetical protein